MSEWLKPFRYPKLLTKEQIQQGATPKKKQRSSDWKASLKRIWDVVDEQRLLLIAVLALVLISSLLALAGPFLLGMIIDQYIVPEQMDGLGKMLLLLLAIYFGLSLTMYGQNYWMVGIAQQTVYRLRTALFAKLQKLPISFFDKRQHGEIMSRLTNDIDNISQNVELLIHSSIFEYHHIDRDSRHHALFKPTSYRAHDDDYSYYVFIDALDYATYRDFVQRTATCTRRVERFYRRIHFRTSRRENFFARSTHVRTISTKK